MRKTIALSFLLSLACSSLQAGSPVDFDWGHPFGVNNDFHAEKMPSSLYSAGRQIGFKWMRIDAFWNELEPTEGNLDLTVLEGPLSEAEKNGYRVLITFIGVPDWVPREPKSVGCNSAKARKKGGPRAPLKGDYFRSFTERLARSIGNRVSAWELTNEPNGCGFWSGGAKNFRTRIFEPGFDGLKAGLASIGNPPHLIGGPGTFVEGQSIPLSYVMSHGKLTRPIDFFSFHYYGPLSMGIASIKKAGRTKLCMEKQPDGSQYCVKDFWLTEFGFASYRGKGGCCSWGKPADAGKALSAMMKTCIRTRSCKKSFIWNLYSETNFHCDIALYGPDGTPRDKIEDVRNTIDSITP